MPPFSFTLNVCKMPEWACSGSRILFGSMFFVRCSVTFAFLSNLTAAILDNEFVQKFQLELLDFTSSFTLDVWSKGLVLNKIANADFDICFFVCCNSSRPSGRQILCAKMTPNKI